MDPVVVSGPASFWSWFLEHEGVFHAIVKSRKKVDEIFLEKLMPKLQAVNPHFYCLTGMHDEDTVELIVTAEGNIASFVFVEQLMASAPVLRGWKWTALKPPGGMDAFSVEMQGFKFDANNLYFFSNEHADYPDEIDITLVHPDLTEDNRATITNGAFIYLDNALGELNVATLLDRVQVSGMDGAQELIPIKKLNDFLLWREKEFVEKYKEVHRSTDKDTFTGLEGEDAQGLPMVAIINKDLLEWDAKASHPWMLVVEIAFRDNNNGMPYRETQELMSEFEEALLALLPEGEGYLNLGRQTYNGIRSIYVACQEFRHVSKRTAALIAERKSRLVFDYHIYKDKYWMTTERFR